ncbi:leucyl-tRNA synthetase [Sporocytophaga myxococcoides]|uniref:Leucine--tRNA ligase n=1 Tax=Sporocytophaga myxococcoides TaxID=153721 RepID=A0A098LMX7_9BACT|nr:leucine--tRNA ligase [Sporocytophaga myxococcoides]GAL87473.1 leucyl-tRNA synthetase [Sporocytophaga myxococcoides]
MADYNFQEIEKKWQDKWEASKIFEADTNQSKPKYYALDMFPYPSGAGLHVGHPLGYIATDIVARYKRIKGYNVLHPMGFDSFGLPAEQYAMQTGQHPAITTEQNITRYKEQLKKIGFSYDWSREVRTSNADYYKWTQWIFTQLFKHWYNKDKEKAEPIVDLIKIFETSGNKSVNAVRDEDTPVFSAEDWKKLSERAKQEMLLKYRLTFLSETMVNWCPELGTVLANEEVKDGVSERGGYPVIRKKMLQWSMRITAYAERLLAGLDTIDWPEPMKEMQRNWIGKSLGAELTFKVEGKDLELKVFTTRIDTTFGVTFVSIAPEHELISELTTPNLKAEVEKYVETAKNRSERDRMSDVKTVSGQFTGSYVINPFNEERIPIYIADYVLSGYGTGVVMAVPSSDTRDYAFAKHFNLPIIPVQEGEGSDITKDDFDPKKGTMINSAFLNGLTVPEAIKKAIEFIEQKGIGKAKINFKMRDSIFGRQRYWGEPIPVSYDNDGMPVIFKDSELPLILPPIDEYRPTEAGDPPLGRNKDFVAKNIELSTMPGWAGSSWYYLRYMDPKNSDRLVGKEAEKYWNQVDLYIGGAEHATGHLLYSRFWNKFLKDIGYVSSEEPFAKLINQGMIQGRSNFVYRIKGTQKYASYNLRKQYDTTPLHVDVNIVNNDVLDTEAFKAWRPDFAEAEFILEDGKYICGSEVEKMSKSLYNVVNPDDIVAKYGADTLRLYEMFLGPLEQFKPWNTNGIEGVYKFLRKLWNLCHDENGKLNISDTEPTKEEYKALHKTIKKVEEDIERFSFNTSVSTFMICVNELSSLKCNKKKILSDLLIVLSPYAPHIAEELWSEFGNKESILKATYPAFRQEYLTEESFEYPISINGKMRVKLDLPLSLTNQQIEETVLSNDQVQKWLEGKAPKKVIVVPNKIVNLVI